MVQTPQDKANAEKDLRRAIVTSPYKERSHCFVILAPGAVHADRVSLVTRRKEPQLSYISTSSVLCFGNALMHIFDVKHIR